MKRYGMSGQKRVRTSPGDLTGRAKNKFRCEDPFPLEPKGVSEDPRESGDSSP